MTGVNAKWNRGVTLIEMMIAMLIGLILLIGLVQVFAASKEAYRLSQGVSHVQENARFAMDYLQRDIRMVGHMGCVNDQARLQNPDDLVTHISAADNALNFRISIQGYEATGSAPGGAVNIAAPAGGWTPGLPAYITGLAPAPVAGSDVIVLRYLGSDGIPVTTIGANSINVDPAKWSVLTQDGVAQPAIFGISDCAHTDVFQASAINAGAGVVASTGAGGVATGAPAFATRYTQSPEGQTFLYRGEAIVYYVAIGASGVRSLYRARFNTAVGGLLTSSTGELVEGVDSLQLLYGQDQSVDMANLTGNILAFNAASALGNAVANENQWRRVGQVKVGMLLSSPERASATAAVLPQSVLGTTFNVPVDGRYRSTYEASIALRNRLYGN